jgi:hypothetical protein
MIALFLLLVVAAIALGIVGVVVKGLFYGIGPGPEPTLADLADPLGDSGPPGRRRRPALPELVPL